MERISKLINMDEEMVKEIEMYQHKNKIISFTQAVILLINEGLKNEKH